MSAVAKLQIPAAVAPKKKADDVLIHVRYTNAAEIFTIDGLPTGMEPRTWLNLLLEMASKHYATFANGRGFFRIPRDTFAAIEARVAG